MSPETILSQEFARRRAVNARYSMRAFARDVGLGKSIVADVLAGKRKLSPASRKRAAERLPLPPVSRLAFEAPVAPSPHAETRLDDDRFALISVWYHLAILNYVSLPHRAQDPETLAAYFGISAAEAGQALATLKRLGLVCRRGNRWIRTEGWLEAGRDVPSPWVRAFHAQVLDLARRSLERDGVDRRNFDAAVLAIDPAKLPEAKALIRSFKRRLSACLARGKPSRVYALEVALFPFTLAEEAP